jgi:hypothetical protein
METIELEKGWLFRQMEETIREVDKWPDVMKPLTTINASLVHQPAVADQNTAPQSHQTMPENSQSGK